MPIYLNGNYYQVQEIAQEAGMAYATISQLIRNREGIVDIGRSYLVPESLAKLIISEIKEIKEDSIGVSAAAVKLKIYRDTLYLILGCGLPCLNLRGKTRISMKLFAHLETVIGEIIKEKKYLPGSDYELVANRVKELLAADEKND